LEVKLSKLVHVLIIFSKRISIIKHIVNKKAVHPKRANHSAYCGTVIPVYEAIIILTHFLILLFIFYFSWFVNKVISFAIYLLRLNNIF